MRLKTSSGRINKSLSHDFLGRRANCERSTQVNYRVDPDSFVFRERPVVAPASRMRGRRVCAACETSWAVGLRLGTGANKAATRKPPPSWRSCAAATRGRPALDLRANNAGASPNRSRSGNASPVCARREKRCAIDHAARACARPARPASGAGRSCGPGGRERSRRWRHQRTSKSPRN